MLKFNYIHSCINTFVFGTKPNKINSISNFARKFNLLYNKLMNNKYNIGDKVSKQGGDYTFDGIVVAVFAKLSGAVRYVVEDNRGVLHVYSEKILVPTPSFLDKLKSVWYKIFK